jgi:cell wall-associated NlpC family hydrolase
MASARARVGATVSVALALTLIPALTSPASAVVSSDGSVSTSLLRQASTTTTTTTASTLSTSQSTVTTVVAPSYSLPSSRTGKVVINDAALADPVIRGRAVIQTAARFKGIPYVAGGTSPSTGFDCSGYTKYVFSRLGISIPRVSRDQYSWGIKITKSQAVPGDLVFFASSSGRIYHAAIYAGGGYIWHSPYPGKRVSLDKIWSSRISFARVRV